MGKADINYWSVVIKNKNMGVKDFPQESLPINGANFGSCLMQEVKDGSRDMFNDDFLSQSHEYYFVYFMVSRGYDKIK